MELRKEKEIKRPQSIEVSISKGRVVISYYSTNNDRNSLLTLMAALGVSPDAISESWCG